jgi:hypothetical protein
MRQFEKEYRAEMPETIGETDRAFDDQNYSEFLERWIVKLLATPAVIGSLPDNYWEQRCKLIEKVEEENPCDPDITSGQIEAWSNYHKFIKEYGQRQ